jgi:hypothetical protein
MKICDVNSESVSSHHGDECEATGRSTYAKNLAEHETH